MGNFKVKVNSQAESKEAQELFQKLLGKENGFITIDKSIRWVVLYQGHVVQYEFLPSVELNEITLAELRDMVVLKRNDVKDATHENSILKYFKACDDWYYFDLGCTDKWQKSAGAKPEYYEKLREINMDAQNTDHHEQPSLNDQYAEIEQVRQAAKDNVDHPGHYTQGKVECIDALESATIGKSGIEAVCVANVIKYLWRYEEKNGLEDVKKAQWYLDRLVASMGS